MITRSRSEFQLEMGLTQGVHHAIPVEVHRTALARSPGTQHESQIGSTDEAVTVKILRAPCVGLVNEQARHPFGVVDERIKVVLKRRHHVVAVAFIVINGLLRRVVGKRPPQHSCKRKWTDLAFKRRLFRQSGHSVLEWGRDFGTMAASEEANGKSQLVALGLTGLDEAR